MTTDLDRMLAHMDGGGDGWPEPEPTLTPQSGVVRHPDPVDTRAAKDDEQLWSVTTIIGALDKPALIYWAAEETAKAAIASINSLPARLEEEGEEAVVKWLRDARFRRPRGQRSSAELGTAVHAACEDYALTGIRPQVDPEVQPFLDQFDRWAQRFQPEYQAAEMTVYNRTYGYAGTADAFLTIGGVRFLADYKTSRKSLDSRGKPTTPYPEQVGLQLAAYRYAEFGAAWVPRRMERFRRRYYLLGPDEAAAGVPVPEVDTGLVIHITPDHCEAYPIRCDTPVHDAFLYTLEAARWVEQTSKSVMSDPLTKAI